MDDAVLDSEAGEDSESAGGMESSESFRAVLDCAPEEVFVVSSEGKIRYQGGRVSALAKRRLLGSSFESLLHPTSRAAFRRCLERAILKPTTTTACEVEDPERSAPFLVRVSASPEAGECVLFVASQADRIALDEALSASRERYVSLYENGLVAMLTFSIKSGTPLTANERGLLLFGYSSKSGLLVDFRLDKAFVRKADWSTFVSRLIEETEVLRHQVHLRRKDGETFWAEISARLHPLRGEADAVIVDTTERKRLEAQLLLSDRLASVGTLAAGVAHEINNPLTYVISNLEYLRGHLSQREDDQEQTSELRTVTQDALEGAERMRTIVLDLKTFSRGGDGRTEVVDIRRVLDAALNITQTELRHRALVERDYSEVPQVLADEARLGQVFINLLINAAQALPDGRAQENRVFVRVLPTQDSGSVVVEIEDTGPGIPPDLQKTIFDPFFTTKPVGQGTGLGLSICHSIVASLGGELTQESRPDRGALFRVRLPVAPDSRNLEAKVAPPSWAPPSSRPKGRLLIVEDDPAIVRALGRILSKHDLSSASNGREALELLAVDRCFDAILCDVMMPEVGGIEVYEQVRQLYPGLEQRILFMTGGAFTAEAREFLDNNAVPQLEKPIDMPRLKLLVAEMVARGDS